MKLLPLKEIKEDSRERMISVACGLPSAALGIGGMILLFSYVVGIPIGSQQFFHSPDSGQNSAPVTIQGNRIIDTVNPVAIDVGNLGVLMLLDNQIRSRQGAAGPVVKMSTWATGGDIISVGNTYTVSNPIAVLTVKNRVRAVVFGIGIGG